MPPEPSPTPVQALSPDLARRFGLIVGGLVALVAHHFLRDPRLKSLILPLCTYLNRKARRFNRLIAQIATNRAPKPRAPRPHGPNTAREAAPLPTGRAWLVRALGSEAANHASQLDHLLAEPGVADLLAASPAAARILRPLGRMLGLTSLAPKRAAPRPRTQDTPRRAATPRRAPLPPLHPDDPTYRPSANWPRGPWPAPRWPRSRPA